MAVLLLDEQRADAWCQAMGAQLAQSATALGTRSDSGYALRSFAASTELTPCGHGCAAASFPPSTRTVVATPDDVRVWAQKVSMREIGRRLDRSASTVSRELKRNTAAHEHGRYDTPLAHARARTRGTRPGRSRLATDAALLAVVPSRLEEEWNPEQIAAHLRLEFPDRRSWHLCHETIYQALYRGARGGLNRQLTKRLRTGRPLRKRRRRSDQRRTRYVVPHQQIGHRPAIVTERSRIGDWESQWCCQAAFALGGALWE